MTSRRIFLRSTSLLCAAVAVLPGLVAQASREQSWLFSDQNLFLYTHDLMTESALRRQIGSSFTVTLPGGASSSIRLTDVVGAQIDVARSVAMSKAVPVKGFRLAFAVEGRSFPQGSYTLEHAVTGAVVMFLVPGDEAGAVKSCSAIFTTM